MRLHRMFIIAGVTPPGSSPSKKNSFMHSGSVSWIIEMDTWRERRKDTIMLSSICSASRISRKPCEVMVLYKEVSVSFLS